MIHASHAPNNQEFPFSDSDFRALAELARREFGLSLAPSKKPLVYSRLSRRLKARNAKSFPEYLNLLEVDAERDERLELISALTTNVTSFFREEHHFDTLTEHCLVPAAKRAASGERIRIWSAGCSSGQEPYCIAMSVLESMPHALSQDVKILATDIDPKIVSRARKGSYPVDEVSSIPRKYRERWVEIGREGEKTATMKNDLKSLISFAELNLISNWPFQGKFNAIFCRNVAIYFDLETQQRLWQRFCDVLVPGGHLFIGHSERITGPASERLTGVGITSYRNTADLPVAAHR